MDTVTINKLVLDLFGQAGVTPSIDGQVIDFTTHCQDWAPATAENSERLLDIVRLTHKVPSTVKFLVLAPHNHLEVVVMVWDNYGYLMVVVTDDEVDNMAIMLATRPY
jgi:hypothetical protein